DGGDATKAREMIPDDFERVLRNGKRHAADGAGETVAAFGECGGCRVAARGVVNALRAGGAAAAGINDDLISWIRLEEGDVAGGGVVAVFVEVCGGDGEERLVAGKRIGMVIAGAVARRRGDSAAPRGNGAGGIAGAFGPDGGEVGVEAGELGFADGGEGD